MHNTTQKEKIVAGLDIGSDSIKLALGKYIYSESKLEIINLLQRSSEEISYGYINSTEKVANKIFELVKEVEERNGLNINVFRIGISDLSFSKNNLKKTFTSENNEKILTQSELDNFKSKIYTELKKKDENLLYISSSRYIIDDKFETLSPIGQLFKKIEGEFQGYYLSSSNINNVYRTIEYINKHIDKISISHLLSTLSILTKEEEEEGTCILDIGKSMTKINIYLHGSLQYSTIFPIGSDNITLDIKEAFSVTYQQAEKIKTKFSTVMCQNVDPNVGVDFDDKFTKTQKTIPLKAIAAVIEARMTELLTYFNKILVDSGLKNTLKFGVVLTGAGAKMTKLCELVETITNMECRLATFNSKIKIKPNLNDPLLYSNAVGLVMNSWFDIDYKDNFYKNLEQNSKKSDPSNRNYDDKKGLLNKVWTKTRSLLIDDFVDD